MATEEINKRVLEQLPLVKYLAYRMTQVLPANIEFDDLVSSGSLGLIDAANKFNPERRVKFNSYAGIRIKGAMLDELKSLDWASRYSRRESKKLEKARVKFEQQFNHSASEAELAEFLNIRIKELHRLIKLDEGIRVSFVSLEDFKHNVSGVEDFFIDREATDPIHQLNLKDIKTAITKAINKLAQRQRIVVTLYYYSELTMKEIGMTLGITESRVSQIHAETMLELKNELNRREDKP